MAVAGQIKAQFLQHKDYTHGFCSSDHNGGKKQSDFPKNAIPSAEILAWKCQGNRMCVCLHRGCTAECDESSLTLLISIFHQVLWHISNFHLGKIITHQQEAHKKLNPHPRAEGCRY